MMTHLQVLVRELVAHGSVTYRELIQRYGAKGYTRESFVAAVAKARRDGFVTNDGGKGRPIVKQGVCPCCGREL